MSRRLRCFVTLLLILGIVGGAALAQEAELRFGQLSAEIIYPAGLHTSLELLTIPETLSAVTLEIVFGDRQRETLTLIPSEIAQPRDADGTLLTFDYRFSLETLPRWFENLEVHWKITWADGVEQEAATSLPFTDARALWVQAFDPSGQIELVVLDGINLNASQIPVATLPARRTPVDPNTAPTPENRASQIASGLWSVYELLTAQTGLRPTFRWLVYVPPLTPDCAKNSEGQSVGISPSGEIVLPCDEAVAAAILRESGLDWVPVDQASFDQIESQLTSRMVAPFYAALWTDQSIPAWFRNGFEQFVSRTPKGDSLAPLQLAARTNRLYPLTEAQPTEPEAARLWSAQSYGLVLYLASRLGVQGVFDLVRDMGTAESFDALLRTRLSRSANQLRADFERWLFSEAASTAFNLSLYQGPTPTPTVTRTPQPTITPSATRTLTATPSATVTGVLSPTPTQTRTASITPTRAPATVTPRPPGSLPTIAPTAAPAPQGVQVENPGLTAAIVVVGLALIAGLIVFLVRRR